MRSLSNIDVKGKKNEELLINGRVCEKSSKWEETVF